VGLIAVSKEEIDHMSFAELLDLANTLNVYAGERLTRFQLQRSIEQVALKG
jgi:hypothetical protein